MRTLVRPVWPSLIAVALLAAGCGSGSSGGGVSSSVATATPRLVARGRYAGYVEQHATTSISAAWRVPRIAAGSGPGGIGTWIGAEAPGALRTAPFIQIGTNEQQLAGATSFADYYAFWSGTAEHFHPIRLFDVRPGQLVTATMRLAGGHWTLTIVDPAAHRSRRLTIGQDADGTFNEALWVEEDIVSGQTGRGLPIPKIGPTHFSRLDADGHPIGPGDVLSQWMRVTARRSFAPGPLVDHAFTLRPATLGPAARRYLALIGPLDDALNRFDPSLSPTVAGYSRPLLRAASRSYVPAERRYARALAAPGWPHAAGPLLRRLVADSHTVIGDLQQLPATTASAYRPWYTKLQAALHTEATTSHSLRRALHAPQLSQEAIPASQLKQANAGS